MLGVDPEFGASVLRLWVAAGSAALLVVFCALAFFQHRLRLAAHPATGAGFVIAGAAFGAVMTWAFLDRAVSGDATAERRVLEMRAQQLSSQALMPGSPLACLDALAGETVEAACEKALFGSPASVASASAYVGAQLTLLASTVALARHEGVALEGLLAPLRRSLESDRFGFVAHVLAIRDGCTAQNCKTLALFRDAKRVRTNLTTSTLERYLEHYAAVWSTGSEVPPLADATQTPASPTGSTGQGTRKIVNIDFPSAASIPAVSIMNPEPTGPVLLGVAAAAAANPNPSAAGSAAPRHTRRQSPNPNATITGQSTQSAVEPIWPEPVPPPAGAAPPAASAPAAGSAGPVQLIPPPPNASAGAGARTQ